jgi:hypothetical protein
MKQRRFALAFFLLFSLAAATQAIGQEHVEPGAHHDPEHPGHDRHKHHLGLFLGGATKFEDHGHTETGFSVGLDYEFRFARKWGVGGLLEGVLTADVRDLAFVVPLSFHPVDPLKLSAGPGFETDGDHTEFMFRFAAAYGFEVRRYTLSPEVSVDLTEEAETLVFGFSVGRGF